MNMLIKNILTVSFTLHNTLLQSDKVKETADTRYKLF